MRRLRSALLSEEASATLREGLPVRQGSVVLNVQHHDIVFGAANQFPSCINHEEALTRAVEHIIPDCEFPQSREN